MSIELKLKAKSLAAEARIIRREEAKIGARVDKLHIRLQKIFNEIPPMSEMGPETQKRLVALERIQKRLEHSRNVISSHRKHEVRKEARYTNVARGFLRGRPYRQIEATCRHGNELNAAAWEKIAAMIRKYGPKDIVVRDGRIVNSRADTMQRFEEWRSS